MAMEGMVGRGIALAALGVGLAGMAGAANAIDAAKSAATTTGTAVFKRLHYFAGDDGAEGFGPYATLVLGTDGNFYGTTFYGGPEADRCNCSVGGTVYRMTPAGVITVLHTFMSSDGASPAGGLAIGPDGSFYGTTVGGGDYGGGTAFKIDMAGNFKMLHSFGGPAKDGSKPWLGTLALGADGNFYGVNSQGGAGSFGTLFSMTPAGVVTVLHAFAGGASDGATPRGGVMFGTDGGVYGTTLCGGSHEPARACGGTVYRWTAKGGFVLLHSFDPATGVHDGFGPQATLTQRGKLLYGTTTLGGDAGAGTVFKLPLAGGTLATLHSFAGGVDAAVPNSDGKAPVARLVLGKDNKLYGTTSNGGTFRSVHPEGDGTIFSIDAGDVYAQVFAFGQAITYGAHPIGGLVLGSSGNTMYGVTENGSANYTGVFYSFTPAKTH
jgi:uncharacterized repeat protein (TIGR03803 family)